MNIIKFIIKAIIYTIIAFLLLILLFAGKGEKSTQQPSEVVTPAQVVKPKGGTSIPAGLSLAEEAAYCSGVFEGASRFDKPQYQTQWQQKSQDVLVIAFHRNNGLSPKMEQAAIAGINHAVSEARLNTVVMNCSLIFQAK